jgi:ribosomal protein L10
MTNKDIITVEDKEYDVAELTEEQKVCVAHLRNLNAKATNLRMDLDQLQTAYNVYSNTLTASLLEEANAEAEVEDNE